MENVQKLTGTGGCSKHVYKYTVNIDEKNYVVIEVNGEVRLLLKNTFMNNAKVSSSKSSKDK